MIAQQEIWKAHVTFPIHHRRVIVVNSIREIRCWPEVAIAYIEVAETLDVDVIIDTVVASLAFFEFVGAFHLDDIHLAVIAPKSVDRITIHCNTNNC